MKTWIWQGTTPPKANFNLSGAADELGGGAMALTQYWERGRLEWELDFDGLTKAEADRVTDAVRYHGGVKIFWFDGGLDGEITEPIFLGYGDSARKDFYLPFRHIYAPSLVMAVNHSINTSWTCVESSGLVSFTSAPAANAFVEALRFKCKYKAFFVPGDPAVHQMTDYFKAFGGSGLKIREHTY